MGDVEQSTSTRAFWSAAALSALLGAGYLLWLRSDVGSPRLRTGVSDLVFILAPLAAALAAPTSANGTGTRPGSGSRSAA